MIWFGWQVSESGYRCADGALFANSLPTAKAWACLREEFAEVICLEFAKLDCSPESVCDFSSRFGLLKSASEQPESISIWEEEVNSIRSVLLVSAGGDSALTAVKYSDGWSRQAGVDAGFLPNAHKSQLEFRCMPRDFSSWLWLQIGHTLNDRKVGQCKQCASLFFKGGGKGRRRAQSRSTRQFCSLECKISFNNLLSKNRRLVNQK
jgi:hypothetical protein